MKTRPSRTFVYLTMTMTFLLIIGLVVVGTLVTSDVVDSEQSLKMTVSAIQATNASIGISIAREQTATFTALHYTADMSPTALPRIEESTAYLQTQAAYDATATWFALSITPYLTPTPPYDPELYQQRRVEAMGLITGGGPTEYARFYATETALVAAHQTAQYLTATLTPTVSLTPSPTALPTLTADEGVFIQCAYAWARRDLPDVTTLAAAALAEAGIADTSVRVEAYGEECIDFNTNTVKGFGAMTTDFYLTAQVNRLTNQLLADYVVSAYTALTTIPQDSLPARFGYLDIRFTSGDQIKRLRTMFDTVKRVLDEGLSGAALLAGLGGLR